MGMVLLPVARNVSYLSKSSLAAVKVNFNPKAELLTPISSERFSLIL